MEKKIKQAIEQIEEEKGIPKEKIIETLEAALVAAFRKDYGKPDQNIKVDFDIDTGSIKVYDVKEVVEKIDDKERPKREQILLKDAKKIKKDAKIGDKIKTDITPAGNYGRIAAQTAKQVIIQRIREAERDIQFNAYKDKEGTVINAIVQRIEGRNIFVDLGQTIGILPPQEQISYERYKIGQRLKVLITSVKQTPKGPEIIVSRVDPRMVEKLFELEVPEIYSKIVKIKAIAREAGSRTKMAVYTKQEGVDPVGSCVGQRGTRVQTVIAELGGEKIDIIEWDEDISKFIAHALSPAKVTKIKINEKNKEATVTVEENQLSLAIGKGGQNVRLAAKLTGWKIDVVGAGKEKDKNEKKIVTDTVEKSKNNIEKSVDDGIKKSIKK